MSVDKLVDSSQLDSDLTSVANAIRAKSGGSSQLAFPAGFVSEIQAIPSGGGDTFGDYLANNLGDYSNETLTTIPAYAFYRFDGGAGNLRFPNVTAIQVSAFNLTSIGPVFFAPKAELAGDSVFNGNSSLVTAILGRPNGRAEIFRCYTQMALTTVEFADSLTTTVNKQKFGNRFFERCANLTTLILRSPIVCPLASTATFDGTPFASGGTGGTIYIPKSLYDHLGDGTALDYKAATNWSTINGYGTITWAKIEGSIYENAYADGTPIT